MKKPFTLGKVQGSFLMGSFLILSSMLLLSNNIRAQVASYYIFSQSSGTYTPGVSTTSTTPANIFATTWDDVTTVYALPFDFTYNGTLYPAGSGYIGLDADGWITFSNGSPTMTGTTGGGSWISTSDQTGVYLYGTGNNNGFAGFNCDLNEQTFSTISGTLANGNNTITAVSSVANIVIGTRLSGTGITNGTVVTSFTANSIVMSAPATATGIKTITPRSSVYAFVRNAAPNRQFVIQWTQAKRYSSTGENINFQMILNEGNNNALLQTLQVMYGTCTATSASALEVQVGLRGADMTDFNARLSTSTWAATTAATANTDHVRFSNTINPAPGLTYTWSPCTNPPGGAGAITGQASVCPNTTQAYSITAIPGATSYTWTYSGTGTTFTASTTNPTNSFIFSSAATSGTITVTPVNLCGMGAASSLPVTVTVITPATISYPLASYCASFSGTVTVTLSGPAGGTYSSVPAGLSINAATGTITPSASTPGSYSAVYTYSSAGCSVTATVAIAIAALPAVMATASPATVCTGSNVQLTATVTGTSGGYTVTSIPFSSATPAGSPTILWNSYIDDGQSGFAMPFPFTFYGAAVGTVNVTTNGYVELNTSMGASITAQTLPNAATPNNIIALAWYDLVIDPSSNTGSSVRYFVNGSTPNRVLVIDYINLRFIGGTGSEHVTGQIRLFEADNHIEVAATTVNDNGGNYAKTMGIENSTGTLAATPAGRNNVVWNTSNEAWSFTPAIPTTYTYSWSPATFLNSTSIYNPVATAVASTTNYTVNVTDNNTGCVGTSSVLITAVNPLNGTYTVGAGGNFSTITAAVNAYNAGCIGGPIVFSLIDNAYNSSETFPIVINSNASASSTNTLTFKPAVSKTPVISGSSAVAIFKLNGADYVTFDGSNAAGGTSRDLSILNNSTNSSSTVCWLNSVNASNGATYNSIKNCVVSGNAATTTFSGIISSGSSVGAIAEAANNGNVYQNNLINNCLTALAVVGPSGNESNTIITGNTIGTSNSVNMLGLSGIETYQQANALVTDNIIYGITTSTTATTSGISVFGTAAGITISGNTISNVKNTNTTGFGCNGIYLASTSTAANVNVYNNFIFDIAARGYLNRSRSDNGYGIIVNAGAGYNIYYNTVHLNTSQTSDGYPACLHVTSNVTLAGAINLKNNIFSNSQTNSGDHFAIESTASKNVFGLIDFNDYYTAAANLGYIGSNRVTLANVVTGFGQNTGSINYLPVYRGATDLHIDTTNAGNITFLKNKANPIATYTSDIDKQTRNGLTPDLGADEWVEPNYGSWVGKISTDWLVPANWEANYVPDLTTDVFITGGYTFMPTILTTQAIRALTLSSPGTPPLLTINGGTLKVFGDITRTGGTIDGTNGTLQMSGSAAQTIPASLFVSNNLKNLVISNTNAVTGVTLGGTLDIYRSLSYGTGGRLLTTNDFLTFKSTATETAWLGQMSASNVINGKATVERFIPLHNKAWQFLATPITQNSTQTVNAAWQEGSTAVNDNLFPGYGTQLTSNVPNAATRPTPGFDVYTAAGPSIKTYNRTTGGYNGLSRTDTLISNPRGFFVFVRGNRAATTLGALLSSTVMRTKGTLYTPASPPATVNLPTPGFESVGNPYASAIDFRLLNFTGGVQTDFYYMWDPQLTSGPTSPWGLGGFQTFSVSGGAISVTPGGGSYSGTNRNIESGEAFFINAPFSAGTLNIPEGAKVSGSSIVNRVMPAPVKQLRTNLHVISGEEHILLDGNLVQFDHAWSNAVDIKDARKLVNSGENFGLLRNGQSLAIERHALVQKKDTIFYQLQQTKVQQYEFEFNPENMATPGLEAWLEDSFLHTSTGIDLGHSSRFVFNIINDPGSYVPNRFMLVFIQKKKKALHENDETDSVTSKDKIKTAEKNKMEGQGIFPSVKVFPNPVENHILKMQFNNQPAGQYNLQLTNKLGQQVYHGSLHVNSKTASREIRLDPSVTSGTYQLTLLSTTGEQQSIQVVIQ